ncbi:MAG: DUF3710 domain-containing protein [Propionicimonas sp.]|nr:DUF3710 domain-containing protein [Propionicimonas sp.]
MIFGRKRSREQAGDAGTESTPAEPIEAGVDEAADASAEDVEEVTVAEAEDSREAESEDAADNVDEDEDEDEDEDDREPVDYRADGPFDIEEVDLGGDDVTRIDLGTLIVTPWQGLNLQLQVNEATKQVRAITGIWHKSGIEVALFAAPASGGLADDLREDIVEEAERTGGSAELAEGVFGTEVRRVMPQAGPNGEQLFHVSRIWFAEGPRWLLRGTLLGEAALDAGNEAKAGPFLEFFRNLVVRRGSRPMVPGELITMELPKRDGE